MTPTEARQLARRDQSQALLRDTLLAMMLPAFREQCEREESAKLAHEIAELYADDRFPEIIRLEFQAKSHDFVNSEQNRSYGIDTVATECMMMVWRRRR